MHGCGALRRRDVACGYGRRRQTSTPPFRRHTELRARRGRSPKTCDRLRPLGAHREPVPGSSGLRHFDRPEPHFAHRHGAAARNFLGDHISRFPGSHLRTLRHVSLAQLGPSSTTSREWHRGQVGDPRAEGSAKPRLRQGIGENGTPAQSGDNPGPWTLDSAPDTWLPCQREATCHNLQIAQAGSDSRGWKLGTAGVS